VATALNSTDCGGASSKEAIETTEAPGRRSNHPATRRVQRPAGVGIRTHDRCLESATRRFLVARSAISPRAPVAHCPKLPKEWERTHVRTLGQRQQRRRNRRRRLLLQPSRMRPAPAEPSTECVSIDAPLGSPGRQVTVEHQVFAHESDATGDRQPGRCVVRVADAQCEVAALWLHVFQLVRVRGCRKNPHRRNCPNQPTGQISP